MPPRRSILSAGLLVCAACSDPNLLPDPSFENFVDSTALFAVSGTDVFQPSGYSLTESRRLRLDQSTTADFAFDIRDGQPVLLPGALVGHPGSSGIEPGLQHTSLSFDAITVAEINGYVTIDTLHVAPGDVFYARSRIPSFCFFGLPTYAKLQAISIDPETRTLGFRVLVNRNCGYKGLEPGIPPQ